MEPPVEIPKFYPPIRRRSAHSRACMVITELIEPYNNNYDLALFRLLPFVLSLPSTHPSILIRWSSLLTLGQQELLLEL